jgi:hypothetical protein
MRLLLGSAASGSVIIEVLVVFIVKDLNLGKNSSCPKNRDRGRCARGKRGYLGPEPRQGLAMATGAVIKVETCEDVPGGMGST